MFSQVETNHGSHVLVSTLAILLELFKEVNITLTFIVTARNMSIYW